MRQPEGLGLRVLGFGLRVCGLGFSAEGLGFGVNGSFSKLGGGGLLQRFQGLYIGYLYHMGTRYGWKLLHQFWVSDVGLVGCIVVGSPGFRESRVSGI